MSKSIQSNPSSQKSIQHPNQKLKGLLLALIMLAAFFVVELCAGLFSNSLSLLADAEHILSDVASLAVASAAIWLSRSITKIAIFERYRLEVLAALVNGLGLACIAAWIMKEALVRLQSPSPEVYGLPMLVIAMIGLAVNCINIFYLHGCSHNDINLKGVMLHLFADLVSSVGTIIAAIAVIWLNWTWADGAISLVVATLIAVLAASLVVQSVNCLRGQTETSPNIFSCLCNVPNGISNVNNNVYCIERMEAEKILYPTLKDMIK